MSKTNFPPDYGWKNSTATHAHGFLFPDLLEVFNSIAKKHDKQKIKIIDVGCGNGFLAGQFLRGVTMSQDWMRAKQE